MNKFLYILFAALIGAPSAMADDTVFTYAPDEGTKTVIGSGVRRENDLAILINDQAYVGFEILGVSVNVPAVEGCAVDNIGKAWITKKLTVDQTDFACVPDVVTVSGDIRNYGSEENPEYRLDVTFPEPYVISQEGIYVGYTLTTTALRNSTQKYPLEIISSQEPGNGLFVHFVPSSPSMALDKNRRFLDLSSSNMAVSTMRVFLRGQQIENSAGLKPRSSGINGILSDSRPVEVVIKNSGAEEINEISYLYTPADRGEEEQGGILRLSSPIPSGESMSVAIPFEVPSRRGEYDYDLTITKVNGEENINNAKTATFTLTARPWLPHKRLLIEEYTGLWCKGCPAAYVTMKQIRDKYPDDVIILTFHVDDSMQTIPDNEVPTPGSGVSRTLLDRDGGLGSWRNGNDNIPARLEEFTPADLDVYIYWEDKSCSKLLAEANLKFVDPVEADQYRLTFALAEDDMSDPSWNQYNEFFSIEDHTDDWFKTPYWDLFLGKGYVVSGLVFDDIALVFPDCHGIPESIPALEIDDEYSYSTVLDPSLAIGVYNKGEGQNIIKSRDKLRVVALLIHKETGKVVNAATSGYAADIPVYDDRFSGVGILPADDASEIIAEEYYDAAGVRLAERCSRGVMIVVSHYADGTVKTAKIMQ